MENNDQVNVLSLKKTLNNQFTVGKSRLKKFVQLAGIQLFPWIRIRSLQSTIRSLKSTMRVIKNQNSVLLMKQNDYRGQIPYDEVAGLLNWPELLDEMDWQNGFSELVRLLNLSINEENKGVNRSNCWVLLATKNLNQLLEHGYNNFKRTIGHNYFNFLVQKGDPQITSAESLFSEEILEKCKHAALATLHDPEFNANEPFSYYYFIYLLWEYVKRIDKDSLLERLQEPEEGNPILVSAGEKRMSQDLANSLIEYYSISEKVNFKQVKRVLEIGGGYGRNAHVILSLNPQAKVFLVDIMPALYIAQRYLSSVFRDRKVFQAISFTNFDEVRDEIESASIVFLLPHQLSLLPDNYVDVSMNISSFGEMNLEQIKSYYEQIDRVTRQWFYTKQWNSSKNPFDNLVLNKADYPRYENWKEVYSRDCVIQTEFFETLYQVNE